MSQRCCASAALRLLLLEFEVSRGSVIAGVNCYINLCAYHYGVALFYDRPVGPAAYRATVHSLPNRHFWYHHVRLEAQRMTDGLARHRGAFCPDWATATNQAVSNKKKICSTILISRFKIDPFCAVDRLGRAVYGWGRFKFLAPP